jgi:rRNA-processing protein FCF1
MQKVIFDSSFLMAVAEVPTDWSGDITREFGRFEPVILDRVRRELEGISRGEAKRSRLASLALRLAEGFTVAKAGAARVDDEIVSAALDSGAAVATVDGELSHSLKAVGVTVIGLRKGRVALR